MSTIPEFATKLKNISISGAVSIEQVSKVGPIDGSTGFAVFVQPAWPNRVREEYKSLAPNPSLGISSNKLEGFTQSVNIYRIVNIRYGNEHPIYLVDVPGFADTKISSMGIVSMLRKMIQTNGNPWFYILYFTPIHNPRLPGSQRQVLRTFKALTGPEPGGNTTIVSTMWDLVWGESASRRAESNFIQLQNEIWKNSSSSRSSMVRFQNTQESALTILDGALRQFGYGKVYTLNDSTSQPLRQTPFASNLYDDLQTQIQDEQLIATLIPQLEETQGLLVKFEKELEEFGPAPDTPPTPEPSESIPVLVAPTPNPIMQKKGPFRRVIDSVKHLEKKLHRNRDR
ncbi:hypothetical protein BJ165DRAFT_1410933 [Panaeolus papilionaceus]|nr:hypothetical protein BJ165DRAFT_1410933 [Panaeolus papilionaceus]